MTSTSPGPSHRTALITGASSGLGAEFGHQLAAGGYDLILVARRQDRLEQLKDELASRYEVGIIVCSADLSSMDGIGGVVKLIDRTPDLDMLVNNAGFGLRGRFHRVEAEKELAMLMVHMVAPVMLTRAALPAMVERNRGFIINVSSMAGLIPIRTVLYGTSKSYLIRFSEALQAELQGTQVHVQALCPGFTYTEMHDTAEYAHFSRQDIPKFLWMTPGQV
ncbi:MAG: SDR family NAD(P)-dependent oxidoreductase, partial [Acidobacteriaceae bacterium]